MNITLYELAHDFKATADALSEMDLDDQTIADTLESISLPLEQKAVQVASFVRNLEATAEQIKVAEKQMADRRKAIENRAARVREYLLRNMLDCGITKIEHPLFAISTRQNPASVVIDDMQQIPAEYMRYPEPPPAPYKPDIKAAIEAGKEVPGAHLEHGMRLEIK